MLAQTMLRHRLGIIAAGLHHRMLEAQLLVGRGQHVHLVRVARDQLIDLHRLRLSDAVAARHGLDVILRVPVGVVYDDSVGRRQVDADAARPRREQEEEGV